MAQKPMLREEVEFLLALHGRYLGIKVDIGEVRYTRYNWHSEPVLVVNREMQPQCGFRRRYTFLARASLVRNMLEQNT
jgi:hypothetical protein